MSLIAKVEALRATTEGAEMTESTKGLAREEVETRRRWWQSKLYGAPAPLAEETAFWRSEIAICDMALRSLSAIEPPEDESANAAWIEAAHTLCTDQGIEQGHISDRIEALRCKLSAEPQGERK